MYWASSSERLPDPIDERNDRESDDFGELVPLVLVSLCDATNFEICESTVRRYESVKNRFIPWDCKTYVTTQNQLDSSYLHVIIACH